MFRKTTLMVGALALMLAVPQAQAAKGDWKITVMGGAAVPMGNFSKKIAEGGVGAKLGFAGGAGVDYMVTDAVGIGVDGMFTTNNLNKDELDLIKAADPTFELKYTQIGGGAHVKYWFPMSDSPLSPYVVVGAGATNFKAKGTVLGVAGDQSKTQFGGHGGLGAGYKVNENVAIGLEGDFNYVKLSEADWGSGFSSATSFGINAVVTFGISKAK
jgi:opacity protein-like surface antigen